MKRRAFTLIELLAVIAIVLVLISLLMPAMSAVYERTRRMKCQNNAKVFGIASVVHTSDRDGTLPQAFTQPGGWVDDGATVAAITNGTMWSYINDFRIYQCPSHPRQDILRHYSLNDYIGGNSYNGNSYVWQLGPGHIVTRMSAVRNPAQTFELCEEMDHRNNYMNGSFVTRIPEAATWVDCIGMWHEYGANFSFVDGHAEYWKWEDPRTAIILAQSLAGTYGHNAPQPGNPDLLRLRKATMPGHTCGNVSCPVYPIYQ